MREQMTIDEPSHGPLLDTMRITDGRIPGTLVQPRIEPEIALVLRPTSARAALDVVDSVWQDYRFSLELNSADGSPAAGVAPGPPLPLHTLATLQSVVGRALHSAERARQRGAPRHGPVGHSRRPPSPHHLVPPAHRRDSSRRSPGDTCPLFARSG